MFLSVFSSDFCGILLVERENGWLLHGLDKDQVSQELLNLTPNELAIAVLAFCESNRLDPKRTLISIESNSVLVAKISRKVSTELRTRESLRFHLESVFPLDAESMIADVVSSNSRRCDDVDELLSVAIETSSLLPLIDALESNNIQVRAIVPTAILILQQAVHDRLVPVPSISIWSSYQCNRGNHAVGSARQVEVMKVSSKGQLSDWQLCALGDRRLDTTISLLNDEGTQITWKTSPLPNLQQKSASVLPIPPEEVQKILIMSARTVLKRQISPWVDLRRERLALYSPMRTIEDSLRRLGLLLSVCILITCFSMGGIAYNYRLSTYEIEEKQRALFSSTFPNQKIPAGITTRFRSELAKAKAVRSTDPASIAVSVSALPILHRALTAITSEISIDVYELRVESGRLILELILADQKDVGAVAAALSQAGFAVEPPATSLLEGTKIQTTIIAQPRRSFSESLTDRLRDKP